MIKELFLFFLLFFIHLSVQASSDIIEMLIKKHSYVYEERKGVVSIRDVTAVSVDPDTGKILKKFAVTIERKDYFYKTPVIAVLKYSENGLESEKKRYDTREIEPFYPIFDKNSKNNYNFEKTGNEIVNGKICLKYKVIPIENTVRHFKGDIFVDPEKIELVKLKGTLAKPHWAMKQYDFEFLFTTLDGFPVLKEGKVTARVKVFMIISDNITSYEILPRSNKFF